ncbi:MAG: glycosyltransferase family 2 protein [Actinomycetia bacterium]|nr:glycosyltransferase family 2 protein [Actinomycetes bacterium]
MPVVSVVLIFLNEERFLEEAVRSVCDQTWVDWELILVDDGSTDRSTQIARELACRDVRICYLEHPGHENRGMAASRNLGVANTTAPYIAFIDGDDVWVPTKLAEQVDLLERMPDVAMVNGALLYWHSWDPAATEEDETILTAGVADRRIDPPEAALTTYPLGDADGAGVDLLIRRSVFDAVRGFEERFRGIYEDQSFLLKVFLRYPIYMSSREWLLYRQHEASACAQTSRAGYVAARGVFLDWLKDDVERLGDPRVSAALRRARQQNRYEKLYEPISDRFRRFRSWMLATCKDPVKRCVRLARRYGTGNGGIPS